MGEFETIIYILILFVVAVITLPVVILSKISSLNRQIRELNKKISTLLIVQKTDIPASSTAVKEKVLKKQPVVPTPPPIPNINIVKETYKEELPPLYQQEAAHELDRYEPSYDAKKSRIAEENIMENMSIPVYSMPSVPDSAESPLHKSAEPLYTTSESNVPPSQIPEKEDPRNFVERILGANWLSKIGIVTLVLGIAFFVKYAIDQNWINEVGRVGIGLLTGGIIIGIAHKLKAKYHLFSSILAGGGISVFYITITLAFREYELFNQTTAFILLILITVFSVLLSLLYDRKELAIFSLLGGFASPLLVSTETGNYMVLFSYILILNTGMLVVSFMKQWRIIGVISYVLTLLFFWTWALSSYKDQHLTVAIFISLFFVQFYLLALFDHFKSEKKVSAYQVFLILSNNLSAFLAYLYIFDKYSSDIRGVITISLAVINAAVLVVLFRNSRIDKNLVYLLIAIVMSFVSLAIPIQLKGHVITLFWAAESVVLLWLWQKSRIKVFHVGYILIFILTFISYWMDVVGYYSPPGTLAIVANRFFVTGVVVIASFVISLWLFKRDKEQSQNNLPIIRLLKVVIIFLTYVVSILEINYQLTEYTDVNIYSVSSFRYVALATFTTVYIAILGLIYNKRISSAKFIFGFLYFTVFLYATLYSYLVTNLRSDIFNFYETTYPSGFFSIHLLSLPAIAYIIYLLTRHIKAMGGISNILSWVLTVLVVIILSMETDHLMIWLIANQGNYYDVLYDVHTFGYPILWGIIAMILMIWGLNRKEALLRKISLVFFALIIVKFYAYDVWKMSQAGRIISFVVLGIILLVVSFLQQKIRTLVKDEPEKIENKINEMNEPDNIEQ